MCGEFFDMAKFGINQPRFYRFWTKDNPFVRFEVKFKETDLLISASRDLQREALESCKRHRKPIEDFIKLHPDFQKTLKPYPLDETMAPIIKDMTEACARVGVGPMAAVAGAVAEYVGRDLLENCDEVIVENGGDIFIKVKRVIKVGVYAADSPFTGKISIEIEPQDTPLGICTSSGTVGPSLSFGTSDATIVLARSAAFSDACATAIGNLIKEESDIPRAVEYARGIKGLYGVALIKGKKMGAWGKIRFSQ